MWIGKRIFPHTVQPLVASIGPETHSLHSSFRLGSKGVSFMTGPFMTGPKRDGNRRTHRHPLRHRLRSQRRPRIMGLRLFWCSCVLAFLKDWGGWPENGVLPHREDRSTDGGIADSWRRKTPLVLPYEGRDAKARVVRNLREQGLSLVGGRRSSYGKTERVLRAGGRRSSSGERPRRILRRDEGICERVAGRHVGVAGRHGFLHAR